MKNPRTTLGGIATIVGSLLTFAAVWISTGHIPPVTEWSVLGGALTVGASLIAAADGKKPE